MTVSSELSRNDYVGNGATDTYSFTFSAQSSDDIEVTLRDLDGLETNPDFTVTFNDDHTGSITLTAGNLTADYALTIRRAPSITQPTSFRNQREFFASRHEDAYDRIVHVCQKLADADARTLFVPVTEGSFDGELPTAETRAERVLGFDSNGDLTTYSTGVGIGATSFANVAVSGQSTVVADSAEDTLNLAAGSNITITTDASTDTVTVAATTVNSFATIAVSGQSNVVADSQTDTLTLEAGSGVTITTNATTDTVTIAASGLALASVFSKIDSATVTAITSATTATINRMHLVSGTSADYDITMPAASGNTGNVVGFQVKDWSAANKQYRLDAGGTVKIAGRTRYLQLLHTNCVLFISDGTDWQPLVLNLDTPWVDGGAITITGSSSNPTKGTTVVDKIYWRRANSGMEAKYEYEQSTGSSAGSGTYLLDVPFTIDTTLVKAFGTAGGSTKLHRSTIGPASFWGGTLRYNFGTASVYDSGKIRITSHKITNVSSGGIFEEELVVFGSAEFSFGTNVAFSASISVPIVNW